MEAEITALEARLAKTRDLKQGMMQELLTGRTRPYEPQRSRGNRRGTIMKVSTILDHIDSGHMALPEFQRGYVWNRDQVRGLFDSLYRRHPVGGLLVWATESKTAAHRGEGNARPWNREAAARRPAAHDLALRRRARESPQVLRRQRSGIHRATVPPGCRDLRVLPAREDAGRSALDRRDRADEEGHGGTWGVRRSLEFTTRTRAENR